MNWIRSPTRQVEQKLNITYKAIEVKVQSLFLLRQKEKKKLMEKEMVNINANLVKEPEFTSFERKGEEVEVVNFTLVKKYGKGKEYINCSAYGDKAEVAKDFDKGDLIHIFGYFKEREYNGKTYKNFVVKSYNKIEKKNNKENFEEEK